MSLIKLAIVNPIQKRNFDWMKNNPNMGPHVAGKYDLLTNLASQAKTDPSKLPAMRLASHDLKAAGVQKMNPFVRAGAGAAKAPGLINKLKPAARVLEKAMA